MRENRNYSRYKALIEKALKRHLLSRKSASSELKEAIRYAILGSGKRIRPVIVIESCVACGGTPKKALGLACAIELVHNFSLVHDDLPSMDNDDFRRGRLSCHKKYGEAIALLAGDALLNMAYELIAKEKNPGIVKKAVSELTQAVGEGGMIGGQALDMRYQRKGIPPRFETPINRLKTARLFGASFGLGAIAAGSPRNIIARMREAGICLGSAFQITDDIIDGKYRGIGLLDKKIAEASALITRVRTQLGFLKEKAGGLKKIASMIAERRF